MKLCVISKWFFAFPKNSVVVESGEGWPNSASQNL